MYTFTGDISYPAYSGVVVERNNIVIDGAGYTLNGSGQYTGGIGISLNDVNNVAIENINIESFETGIWGSSSSDNIVGGNEITASACVEFDSSSGNSVTGNNMTNVGGFGVELNSCISSTVSENNITNVYVGVPWEPWIGIWLISSSNSTVSDNNVTNEIWGISLSSYSSFNTVTENNITDNEFGIVLGYGLSGHADGECSNNTIYHDNFVDNYEQVLSGDSINVWDNGYPSGGNYWSDYNGTDVYRGVYQNVTGSDGVGDTPYVIDANNTDNYPLMKPYPWGSHDIGVIYVGEVFGPLVSPLKTVIGLGYTLNISAFVMSYGSYLEVFNATVYVNNTVIGTVANVTLASDCSVILNFTWDTSGLAYGNYTISAYVTPVPGQTDMTENTRAVSVYVGIPGDLNGDSTVDIYDAILLSAAFNSSPGSTNWNPNADINGDGIVDIYDAIIMAAYFGQSIP
jgi:parallel beta-helix repeat protein